MTTSNEVIRNCAAKNGVRLWQVAERLGLRDFQFSRMLRHELNAEETARVMAAIGAIAGENGQGVTK